MAFYVENFNLEVFKEEDTFMKIVAVVAEDGKGITGYYGLPYLNLHYGNVQMILRTGFREDGEKGLEATGMDAHATGSAIWECRLSGMEIDRKNKDKLSKRVMVNTLDGDGGMVPVTLVNADVLPGFSEGDTIRMQMIGFPEIIEYFADEDEYAAAQPALSNGRKFLLAEGCIFPSGFMKNRNPDDPLFESDEHLDDITNIRGTVKSLYYGKVTLGEESCNSFVYCDIDTNFGPLQLVHTIGQVKKPQRKNLKVGAVVSFYGLLSGDVAIYEYEKGVVRDLAHDLAALRYMFAGHDPERVRSILSEDCVYTAMRDGSTCTGPDAIIERIKSVQSAHKEQYFAHPASISAIDPGETELPYPVGTRCLVLASGEEDRYESIVFIEVNEDGNVCRITTEVNPRYHFAIDEKPREKDPLEGCRPPESVKEPILARAYFHAITDEPGGEAEVLNDGGKDKDYRAYARQMLRTMPAATDADRDGLMTYLFGWLFAKAAETAYREKHARGLCGVFRLNAGAPYVPEDVWSGAVQNAPGAKRQKNTEDLLDLGGQFYTDFKIFQQNDESGKYDDNLTEALVLVQRLGAHYGANGMPRSQKNR